MTCDSFALGFEAEAAGALLGCADPVIRMNGRGPECASAATGCDLRGIPWPFTIRKQEWPRATGPNDRLMKCDGPVAGLVGY